MTAPRLWRLVVGLLFWPWNLLFVCVALAGLVPFSLVPLVIDAVDGLARWEFVASASVLTAVPILSVIHAVRHRRLYRERPGALVAFFFGVELPLIGITAARLFGFAQLTGAGEWIYLAVVGGGIVAEAKIVLGERLPKSQLLDGAAHAMLVMRGLAGLYVGALLSSLSVPLMGIVSLELLDARHVDVAMLVMSPVVLWGGLSTLLLLVLPVAAPIAWLAGLVQSGREVLSRWGADDLFITTTAPVIASVVIVGMQWRQPHEDVMARLTEPPRTDAERRALVADQAAIAEGLVDAALGRHTYVADDSAQIWSDVWSLDDKLMHRSTLDNVDPLMREASRPFVYKGYLDEEGREARRLYRDFFGRELERDHAPAVRAALASSWSREERFAGFINEGQARVLLEEQQVAMTGHDGVFTVEIHDTWLNRTDRDEEVVIFFELPESAAVTGLWLGPTANRDEAFTHVVAPRGAAQQVYREEVRARRDPALLEQVGPRQYRLRVFPIPPRQRQARHRSEWATSGFRDDVTPRVHVWLRYEALPDKDGRAPLPQLRERRNGFWDAHTTRTLRLRDGAPEHHDAPGAHTRVVTLAATDAVDGGSWVQVPADTGLVLPKIPVAAALGDGCSMLWPEPAPPLPSLSGKTVDVVIDRSFAMAGHVAALREALELLEDTGALVRVVLGTSALRGEGTVAVDAFWPTMANDLVFFGAAQPKHLLRDLITARPTLGDVVVVLTAGVSFDVADDVALPLEKLPHGLPRTLVVHVDGQLPAGSDDATLDAIRRSGGTTTSTMRDGLLRLQDTIWADGYRFEPVVDARVGFCATTRGPGAAIVARQRILLADRGGKAPLSTLDRLHRLAVTASVTTPYSSMIVLVNEAQRQRLAQLNNQQDRFEREVEDESKGPSAGALKAVKAAPSAAPSSQPPTSPRSSSVSEDSAVATEQALAAPTSAEAFAQATPPAGEPAPTATVSGVPEPEEWLLFCVAIAAIAWTQRQRLQRRTLGGA
jgi:putative PEP-CTERM system integral membrane protein